MGLALEAVDGALLEDVTVSNVTMRRIFGAPVFLRIGARMRGPANTPVGKLMRVVISNVVAEGVSGGQAILLAGLKDHPIEDVTLDNILIDFDGGGTAAQADRAIPELERDYPEPTSFGVTPSWGLYARHARNLVVHHVILRTTAADARTAIQLEDLDGAAFEHVDSIPSPGAKAFVLRDVTRFSTQSCAGVPDTAPAKSPSARQM
jgi:hypothetical protein